MSDVDDFQQRLGIRVRALRLGRGDTLRAVAARSHLSVRFLGQVEAGTANPSLASLAELAQALDVTPHLLLTGPPNPGAFWRRLANMLPTLTEQDAAAVLDVLDARRANAQPIALLGLRGAGKTTVGAALAVALDRPFVEVDRVIEVEAGMSLPALFELHGEEHYRSLEARVLEDLVTRPAGPVLAVSGGVVTVSSSFERLRRHARTVWLRASPETHWDRVVAQGDERPMEGRATARDELLALYNRRAPAYARCDLQIDTDALSVDQVVARIVHWLQEGLATLSES